MECVHVLLFIQQQSLWQVAVPQFHLKLRGRSHEVIPSAGFSFSDLKTYGITLASAFSRVEHMPSYLFLQGRENVSTVILYTRGPQPLVHGPVVGHGLGRTGLWRQISHPLRTPLRTHTHMHVCSPHTCTSCPWMHRCTFTHGHTHIHMDTHGYTHSPPHACIDAPLTHSRMPHPTLMDTEMPCP